MGKRTRRSETGRLTYRWRDLRPGPDGKRRQHRQTCPDARTYDELKRAVESAHALGREYVPGPDSAATLTAVLDAYLDDCERIMAASTLRLRRNACDLYMRWMAAGAPGPADEPKPVPVENVGPHALSGDNLARFHLWLRKARTYHHQGVSELTAAQYTQMLRAAWVWASESERFRPDMLPPRRVRLPSARPELRPVAPTWAQMDAVIEQASSSKQPWYRKLCVLLRFTGLRRSQAMRLTWADVDLEAGLLTIRPELGKTRQERSGRVVPLSPHLVAELATWGRREGWLVARDAKTRDPGMVSMARFWAKAGVPEDVWRQPLHSFRKGLVSGLSQLGVPEPTIKALVGHDLGVTSGVYTSEAVRLEQMRAAVALIPPLGGPPGAQLALDLDAARRRSEIGKA